MKIIQVTNTYSGDVLEILKKNVPDGFEIRTLSENTENALMELVSDADYILASGRVKINEDILNAAKKLKMIQRTGVGLDSIDLNALKKYDVPLYVNKGINADSVAEHTLLLMLAGIRRLPYIDSTLRSGVWKKQQLGITTTQLRDKNVGLVGMGSIGCRVAQLLGAFHCKVRYYDLCRLPEYKEKELSVRYCSFDELLECSDIISLHCPLTAENHHLIDRDSINRMKDGALLINTARGGLVCEKDLIFALNCGKISAACLDVFEKEPLNSNSPLLKMNNVIITPHIGGITYDSFSAMMKGALRNIYLFDSGNTEEIKEYRYSL